MGEAFNKLLTFRPRFRSANKHEQHDDVTPKRRSGVSVIPASHAARNGGPSLSAGLPATQGDR